MRCDVFCFEVMITITKNGLFFFGMMVAVCIVLFLWVIEAMKIFKSTRQFGGSKDLGFDIVDAQNRMLSS